MSPVSRGRKNKKTKKKPVALPKRLRYQDVQLPPVPARRTAEWFATATANVLAQMDVLLTATSPREVEQATAELIGAELYRVRRTEDRYLFFTDWLEEVADAAAARMRDAGGEAPLRLLYGMTLFGPPRIKQHAENTIYEVESLAPADRPDWLRDLPQVEATGDAWVMYDVYGSRIGIIASYTYPGDALPSAFLFDIEASIPMATLVEPGLFDDVEQAAAAWRAAVGDAAKDARPELVESPDSLQPLVQLNPGDDIVVGDESRAALDNWFRAVRRHEDFTNAVRERGGVIPKAPDLYHDFDIEPLVTEFAEWYLDRHGTPPDIPAVEALACDWLEGVLPDLWHSVSPVRIETQLSMFRGDWLPEDPMTGLAMAVFPDWVRWNGEQAGLPAHLVDQAVGQAAAER